MTCCYACYLILNYLKMVEVGGGDDGGPCSAGVLNDWSGDGFVCVNECFLVFAPCCTGDCLVYLYGFECLSFGVFYMFGKCKFGVEGES